MVDLEKKKTSVNVSIHRKIYQYLFVKKCAREIIAELNSVINNFSLN